MSRPDFPAVRVKFGVYGRDGKLTHSGTYRINDDAERRAAGQRFHEAMRDGFEIRTSPIDGPQISDGGLPDLVRTIAANYPLAAVVREMDKALPGFGAKFWKVEEVA